MKTERLRCNHCGASLRIPAGARFVTCEFCTTSLEVKREGGVAFTAVVEQVQRLGRKIDRLDVRQRLSALEQQWAADRDELMAAGGNGEQSAPATAPPLIGGGFMTVAGVIWVAIAVSRGAPTLFVAFGVAFVAMAVWTIVQGLNKARAYAQKKEEYETRRAVLQREFDAVDSRRAQPSGIG